MQHNIQLKINHHIPGLANQSCELFKIIVVLEPDTTRTSWLLHRAYIL